MSEVDRNVSDEMKGKLLSRATPTKLLDDFHAWKPAREAAFVADDSAFRFLADALARKIFISQQSSAHPVTLTLFTVAHGTP